MPDDGLTEEQRERLRESFRNGIGSRPDPEEFRRRADEVAAALAQLDGTAASRISLITGFSKEELDELGGVDAGD